ncbi:MAG: phosphoadenylyl-sulfate reductase, partial [Bacteroidales bacterium]|nr:phosphoadenylyl-sulfate reductase [Bacteroidales bacterium]
MISPDQARQLRDLNERFVNARAEEILSFFSDQYGNELAFATSLGAEDQVLTYLLSQINKDVRIFTLDTGRLFPETIDLIDKTNKLYDINISVYFPEFSLVEKMVNSKGINLFYESIENREECCHIRKIIPMKRALKGVKAWVSGLRSEQSVTRQDLSVVSWDEKFELVKINPLLNWTETQLWDFIKTHDIPYNELHDKGYPSIGCQPCTRAVEPGEDVRGGRWWWEIPEK